MADVWVMVVDEDASWRRGRSVTADLISGPTPGHTSGGEVIETRVGTLGEPLRLASTDGISPSGSWWHIEIVGTDRSWDRSTPISAGGASQDSPVLVGALPAKVAGSAPPSWDAESIGAIPAAAKGAAGGVAELDASGLVPTDQLPASSSAVTSVNGATGDVVLAAADVGADPAGAAATALGTAKDYTDTAVSGLVESSDPRLSDARTPTAHAASHGAGGSDPVTVAQSQVTGLGDALNAKADSSSLGTAASLDVGTTAGTVAAGDDSRFSQVTTSTQTADYTLALGDVGTVIEMVAVSGDVTVTVPHHSIVAFPEGALIEITAVGTHTVTVAAGAGVIVESLDGKTALAGEWASAMLRYRGFDEWHLVGALA